MIPSLQEVPLPVVFLQSFPVESPGAHPVGSDLFPQTRSPGSVGEDGVRSHHVDPDVHPGQLQAGDSCQLVGGRLGGAVGAKAGAGSEDVLGGDQDHVSAGALEAKVPGRLREQVERPLDVYSLRFAKLPAVHLGEGTGDGDAGIDDDEVDASPLENDGVEGFGDGSGTGDVQWDGRHAVGEPAVELRGQTLQPVAGGDRSRPRGSPPPAGRG